jgi:hypothetical protein
MLPFNPALFWDVVLHEEAVAPHALALIQGLQAVPAKNPTSV